MARVGFIGLGIMGAPMAANILRKGHALTVHDLSAEAVIRLTGLGAASAASPADVARRCDIVITMLPDAPDVERVALGPDGLLEGLSKGSVMIDMSTSAPERPGASARP